MEFDNSEDFEDYEKKVNSYLTTHADTLPIYKLRHNQPLTAGDYEMLSKIFTEELGTQEDYDRTFQDTTLGKEINLLSQGISKTYLKKVNYNEIQLLQNLQQLPLTEKHIR